MMADGLKDKLGVLLEELARLLVGFAAVVVLNMLLLAGAKAAWGLYSETGTGEKFMEMSSEETSQIVYLIMQPKFDYSLDVTLMVLAFILPAALLLQFLRIRHYLYSPMPFFVKGAWILLAAYFLAPQLQSQVQVADWGVAFTSVLPAALCFIPLCFTVAEHTMPDIVTATIRTKEWFEDRF